MSVVSIAFFVLQSKALAGIGTSNVFVDMVPTTHALVHVFFQFMAFCNSMMLQLLLATYANGNAYIITLYLS